MADTRTYIRVHDGMPDHPKVDGLSDKAFRLLVESWCWCSRHLTDGVMPAATWRKRHTPKARKELIAVGLAEELPGGDIQLHDYLEHQRSAAEVAELKDVKSRGGSYGNHKRWHVDRGIRDPDCERCAIAPPIGSPIANGSESGRKTIASTTTDTDRSPTEIERDGAGSSSSADRYARADSDEDLDQINSKIEGRIIELIGELTGRTVDRVHASTVRRQLLDGRPVGNPLAYVSSCIRGEPKRYLPTNGAPWESPVPKLPPKDPDAYDHGAAEARKRLNATLRKEP